MVKPGLECRSPDMKVLSRLVVILMPPSLMHLHVFPVPSRPDILIIYLTKCPLFLVSDFPLVNRVNSSMLPFSTDICFNKDLP